MKMRLAGMALLVGLCVSSAGCTTTYEIRLERPSKVGEKYRMTTSVRTELKHDASIGDEVVSAWNAIFTLEIVADVTVLAVDKRGRTSKKSFKIIKLDRVEGKNCKELLAKGTVVVTALEKGEQVFHIGKRRVGSLLERALSSLVTLPRNQATDDEVFGTPDRKKVGDSWPMDRKKGADTAKAYGWDVAVKNIKGKTTLERVVKIGGVDYLQIKTDIQMKDVGESEEDAGQQDGPKEGQSKMHMEATILMPVDVKKPILRATSVVRGQFRSVREQGPDGPRIVSDMSTVRKISFERSEIPPEADDKPKPPAKAEADAKKE